MSLFFKQGKESVSEYQGITKHLPSESIPKTPIFSFQAIAVDEIFLDHIETGLNFDSFDDIKVCSLAPSVVPISEPMK